MINMIWAQSKDGTIGKDGRIPWDLPDDLKMFRRLTLNKTVVMGRGTWESLPVKPLPERNNVVLSASLDTVDAEVYSSVQEVLDTYSDFWVIGGAAIYPLFMPYADRLYVTTVMLDVTGDVFAPEISLEEWERIASMQNISEGIRYVIDVYDRIENEE